jgi:Holliday junction resolvasome RuvABC endonuclease subunit
VNTGLVVLTDRGHVLRSATYRYPLISTKKRDVSERDRVDRILHLANDIIGVARTFSVQNIAIEAGGASFGAKSQAIQRGGLLYVVLTQIWLACHIFPELVTASAARKSVLGYGGSGKNQKDRVIEALGLAGITFDTDHEADAYVVARWMFNKARQETRA